MSYKTIHRCATDEAFTDRLTACIAQEDEADPYRVLALVVWPVASASDIEAAYASALAAENPDPGGDESVITDGMILAAVQANWPEEP